MWETILESAAANGIWTLLFLGLLVYLLKDSRAREEKYQKTIESLSGSLSSMDDVKEEVAFLNENLTSYVFERGFEHTEEKKDGLEKKDEK